ncbi:MAG: acyl carrier protein [Clostridiales bacterium]|nr:acyl carrier protein [Clostridiales bacterium]
MDVRTELKEMLLDIYSDVDFDNEQNLVDEGILDSMDIVNLVTEINDNFDISIGAKDMTPDNFNSLEATTALVQKLIDE